jgi:hypothetical protein
MSRIIVYPNNSVSIDDKDVHWDENDFKNHEISMIRGREFHTQHIGHLNEDDGSVKFSKNGDDYLIFSTQHYIVKKPNKKRRRWNDTVGFKPKFSIYPKTKRSRNGKHT